MTAEKKTVLIVTVFVHKILREYIYYSDFKEAVMLFYFTAIVTFT